jgi:hypothetical protein
MPSNAVHNPPAETVVNNTGFAWHDFHFEILTPDWEFQSIVDTTGTFISMGGNAYTRWFKVAGPDLPIGGSVMWDIVLIDTTGGNLSQIEISQTATIPEPGALALFGLGLAGLGFARRRKAA